MPINRMKEYAVFCTFQVASLIDPDTNLQKASEMVNKRTERVRSKEGTIKDSALLSAAQAVWNARMCEHKDTEDHMAVVFAEKASEFSIRALAKAAELAGRDATAAYGEAVDDQISWQEFAHVS